MKPLLVLVVVTVSGLFAETAAHATIARNCDNNAVVFCGGETQAEMIQKITGGDGHNSSQNISQILLANGIDINQISQTVEGTVNKDGAVIVNGQTVATGAQSVGRQFIKGSTRQGSVWIRPTSVSFQEDSLPAFVNMKDGRFLWAIVKSCGNPVVAKPVVVAQITPTPTPAPTPTPKPLPSTGPGLTVLGASLGTFLIWSAMKLYYRSRRQLHQAMMQS